MSGKEVKKTKGKNKKDVSDNKKIIIMVSIAVAFLTAMIVIFAVILMNNDGKNRENSGVNGEESSEVYDLKDTTVSDPFDYEQSGNIVLGEYKGVEVDVAVSDEDVADEVESVLEDAELYVEQQGTPVEGDYVCMKYEAEVDGNIIEDYGEEECFTTVGDEEIYAEFDEALLTMSTGETKNVEVKFSDDWGDELVDGKTVTFKITLNYIAGDPIKQELTDEFVNKYTEGECTSKDNFNDYIKESLYQDNVDYAIDTAWEIVVGDADVEKYNGDDVDTVVEEEMLRYESFAELMGGDPLEAFGMTEADVKDIAEEIIKERMVAKTIAAKENLVMTDEEYKNILLEYMIEDEEDDSISSMNLEELENYYFEIYQEVPRGVMFIEFVKKYIYDNANIIGLK